ncbi:MAG: NifB/NifX family molybdenum-iron cluster-binding protein [Nitrososphaeria archaeon]
MGKLKVAVTTKGDRGLDDEVSEVFGRAGTITVLDLVDGKVVNVQVVKNPAASYSFGVGPILVKTLADMKVDYVIAGEVGPGASQLLKENGIGYAIVNAGIKVREAIKYVKRDH